MNELLRFVALRPALPADATKTTPTQASSKLVAVIGDSGTVQERLRKLRNWLVRGALDGYHYGEQMAAFGDWAVTAGKLDAAAAEGKLAEVTGQGAAALAESADFRADLESLDDSLLVVKYRSEASGVDVAGLTAARIGYDLVGQLAAKQALVLRRVVLALPAPAAPPPAQVDEPPASPPDDTAEQIAQVERARDALRTAIRAGLGPLSGKALNGHAAQAAPAAPAAGPVLPGTPANGAVTQVSRVGGASSPWHLSEASVRQMPGEVIATIAEIAGDPLRTPALALSSRLADAHADLLRVQAQQGFVQPEELKQIGSSWYGQRAPVSKYGTGDLIGHPGDIRPVGIGDLLIVRENVKRYEGGEVAHIENVLRTEKLSRETRRLDRTEVTDTTEVTTDKEEERDTQTTDRASLKRETDSTVKTDASLKAGLSVDAKYGPMVEVKADLQGSYQHQTEDVTKQTTEYSKDVVARSVAKLTTKVRQLQTTITLQEFEEKYGHSFDNSPAGSANVSGVYQFVDKVSQAQVFNYGKRLLFDVIVPEPAAFYIWAQQGNAAASTPVKMPPPLTITPSMLNAGNYQVYAQAYGATGIDPPPDAHRTISQSWDMTLTSDPHLFSKSGTVSIDDGYAALQAVASGSWNYNTDKTPSVGVLLGGQYINLSSADPGSATLSAERGSLPVGLFAADINSTVVTLEILCESTSRAFQVWQEKAYAAIADAYKQQLADYQRALAELQAAQAVAVTGRNPEANLAVIAAELRKSCIEQLTTQHFDAFGAVAADAAGRPETDLGRLAIQGPFERFFEEAFEWDRIVYFFYPYYWADKSTWAQRSLYDDTDDPVFAGFLRAGGARVVFPVRPGFESAVIHYLETGLIWNGGDPPDISSSLYLPIVEEVAEAEQRPGDEVAAGDPWDVRVPTELVKLRPDDSLPSWKKDASGTWVPEN